MALLSDLSKIASVFSSVFTGQYERALDSSCEEFAEHRGALFGKLSVRAPLLCRDGF